MKNLQERTQLNSTSIKNWVGKKVEEKTNTELKVLFEEEMEKSSSDFIINEIKRLNPKVRIKTDSDRWLIFSSVNIEDLILPEWFYFNQKNWITNKHTTKSGIYGSVQVYPIEYYDPNLI